MTTSTVAIIGAGFSGTLLALHALRRCPPATRIVLIERGGQFGRGQAYSTGNPSHLLNVPAARMSAFHDRPESFLQWLQDHAGNEAHGPGSFVPRGLYGAYLRSLLKEEVRREGRGRLLLVRGEVTDIDRAAPRLTLALDRGRTIDADLAVLAVGSLPPAPPPVADPSFYDTPLYRPDPWAADTLTDLDPTSPVLLIGTGLTAMDVVISLLDQGHRGPIHLLSRRGLLPRRHAAGPAPELEEAPELPGRLTVLTRYLRRESARALAIGGNWQPVVDGLRPFSQDLWQCMSVEDRARFLRHLRPWWEVHRHRIAGAVADRIEAALACGQLDVQAGRLQRFETDAAGVTVHFNRRRTGEPASLTAARVVNCSGPGADYARTGHPLVRSLLARGVARPDAFRLGLDVTGTGALLSRDGAISRRIFAVGPATKGTFWEMTAVPDIRRQCETLARHLAALIKPAPARPVEAAAD
jgi:uncharacterized NAD(P)/FAD-binding protein YdhS